MRRPHLLKDNLALDYPQQAIWFDTETYFQVVKHDTLYHHLKFGFACYMDRYKGGKWEHEQWIRYTTRTEFWDWVCSKTRIKAKLYLFCHNTNYDVPVLDVFAELVRRGWSLRSAIIDAPPTILRFRNESKYIMMLDTLNIWRMPLKYLAEQIGSEKLQMPADNDLGIEWDSYGQRDVEIIRDACLKWWDFLETNDFGSFASTLASQSMRVFRHKYMSHKIQLDDNEPALKLTREGYYGARNECFFVGKTTGHFTLVDVNSMYPYHMANHEFPRRLLSHTKYANIQDLNNWLTCYSITARVILRTTVPFACIRDSGKLIFPIGEFECILSTPEIAYALEHAEILEVKECAVYEKEFLFTAMMHDLYARRLAAKRAGNRVDAFVYRLLMNSFYGKWGQNGYKWATQYNINDLRYKTWRVVDLEDKTVTKHRMLGGLYQVQAKEAESIDSFPAIAGHITAYARMCLWELINLAGRDNVFYCDTDSMLVNDAGFQNIEYLINEDQMGKLSIKGTYDKIHIWAAKDYLFGDKQRTKGVRKDAIWINPHLVVQTKWSGLRGLVASGEVDKPITKQIMKHLSRAYDKGVILADGRVLPLYLDAMSPQ